MVQFRTRRVRGGGYQANNNIQSTATIPEGATAINSMAEFTAWLNMEANDNQSYKYGFFSDSITNENLNWTKDMSTIIWELAEGRTFNGNGKSLTISPSVENFELNYANINKAFFIDINRGTICDLTVNTGAKLESLRPKINTCANLGIITGINYGSILGCTSNINHLVKMYVGAGPAWSEHRLGGITGSNAGGAINYCTVNMNEGGDLFNDVYGGVERNWIGSITTRYNGNGQIGGLAGVSGSSDTSKIGEMINNTLNWNGGKFSTGVTGEGHRWLYVGLAAGRRKHETSTSNGTDGSQTIVNGFISNGTMPAIGGSGYTTMNSIVTPNGAPENNSNIYIDDNSVANLTVKGDNTGDNFIYNIDRDTLYFDTDPTTREANRNNVFVTGNYGFNEIIFSANGKNTYNTWNSQSDNLSEGKRLVTLAKDENRVTETKDFEILSGTVITEKFTVGYASGDKVFDGKAIEINNIHGLNLTNSEYPRNAGTYSFELIPDEDGIALVDNAIRIVIPMSSVELGITELTISPKDININLSAMSGLIYNGELQSGISMNITDTDGNSIQGLLDKEALNMNWNNTDKATDAGMHEAFLSDYNRNYNIVDDAYIQFNIGQKTVKPVWSDVLNFKANGKLQLPNVTWEGAVEKDIATAFNVTSNGGINASNDAYIATASVNSNNYIMVGDAQITAEYYINFLTVTAVSLNQFGTVTIDKSEVDYNETVKLSTATKFGYAVTSIMLNGIETGAGTRQFNITEDTVFELTFGARDVNVTINAENGTVTNDKEFKYNNEITLTAVPNDGYEFLNWTTSTGVILSNESTYTFIAIDNFEITANFVTASENGVIYTFLNSNGQLMKTIYAEEGSINLDEIQGSFLPGYTFKEWRAVSGKINTYIARYDIDATAEKMTVAVNGGTLMLSDVTEYTYNSVVTVIANEGAFKYWQDANGQILSYEREYKFAILEHTELTAIFDENAETKNSVAVNSVKDNGDSWAFSASFASIEGYSVIEAGIMITSDANIATSENFVMGSKVMFAKSNKISKYNQYMITANKSVMSAGYARAYMIVNNGTENVIVYSDLIVSTAEAN